MLSLPSLPRLGVGISAEPGSAIAGIGAPAMARDYPDLVHFVEYGTDIARGLDDHITAWADAKQPTTYHFLDLNLEDPADADADWLRITKQNADRIGAAWLCGDAGLWHFGPRDRGHQTLLPPILTRESAAHIAASITHIESQTGYRLLPENPPGAIFFGDMHIVDYFAEVSRLSGCGLLVDCAHLAMFQRHMGHQPLTALDNLPFDRVIEMHVAGGAEISIDGLALVEDAHNPEPLADTWKIFEHIVARAKNLKAVVYECEKNSPAEVAENFARLNRAFPVRA